MGPAAMAVVLVTWAAVASCNTSALFPKALFRWRRSIPLAGLLFSFAWL
jgi:hypothetical protein